jgi:GT2 family glycosyltransferase
MQHISDADGCTAIVLNFRRAELTARCVKSIINQVDQIVIVDNSADEHENQKCCSCVNEIHGHADVIVLNPGDNLGFARGVQYGIEYHRCRAKVSEWLIINNDAIAGKDLVWQLKGAIKKHGRRNLVCPRETSALWYQPLFGLVLKKPILSSFPYLSGACILVPDEFVKPFLFDPEFFMYGEDVELSWRLQKAGITMVGIDALCTHESSSSSHDYSLFYEYHVTRGHILLAKKLARNNIEWFFMVLGRLVGLPSRALLRSLRRGSWLPLKGLLMALFRWNPPAPGQD